MEHSPCQTLSDAFRELRVRLRDESGAQTTVERNCWIRARQAGLRTFEEPHSVVAGECETIHEGGVGWRQATVAVAHQFQVEIEQRLVAGLLLDTKRRSLQIAPAPIFDVVAEIVNVGDVDADAGAVFAVAADLSVLYSTGNLDKISTDAYCTVLCVPRS